MLNLKKDRNSDPINVFMSDFETLNHPTLISRKIFLAENYYKRSRVTFFLISALCSSNIEKMLMLSKVTSFSKEIMQTFCGGFRKGSKGNQYFQTKSNLMKDKY